MPAWLRPRLDWLLLFLPVAVWLRHAGGVDATWVFGAACLAILPLAGWMGRATEHLADRAGTGLGGLLNATFGNAAELIIALMALRKGLYEVVKASITGSIIGNILLVLGVAMLAGGVRHRRQRFNDVAARSQATMLTLAAIALVFPALFHYLGGPGLAQRELDLSLEISVVLIVTYVLGLLFSLRTHRRLFAGDPEAEPSSGAHEAWGVGVSLAVLVAATALVAWMSEILVSTIEHAGERLGMSDLFLGVMVVAVIGNAAEHSTAVLVAVKNRMDLALGIAIGSSVQIALFVAPALVFASRWIGPRPIDLVFTPAEVLAVAVAVLITGQIAEDGESHWFEGVQLLAVYAILAIVFYFLPA